MSSILYILEYNIYCDDEPVMLIAKIKCLFCSEI